MLQRMLFGGYLTPEGLQRLRDYKYQAGDYTALDVKFNTFWNWALQFTPVWIAPNTLTLLGFVCSVAAFLIMAVFVPDFSSPAPRIAYFLAALLAFGYQTLDALDGKQARRTGTSSTLGTLFDHGCDIITSSLLLVSAIMVCRLGEGVASYWTLALAVQTTQFVYLWWEYHLHVFISNPGYGTGVTEAQCCFMGMCLITGLLESKFWVVDYLPSMPLVVQQNFVKLTGMPHLRGNILFAYTIAFNNILANAALVFTALRRMPTGKFCGGVQLVFFFTFLWTFSLVWRHGIFLEFSPVFLAVFSSIAYGTCAVRLLLASTSQRHFSVVQWPLLPSMALGLAAEGVARMGIEHLDKPRMVLRWACIIVFVFQATYLYVLVATAIQEMCRMLNIYCFSITKRPNATKDGEQRETQRKSSSLSTAEQLQKQPPKQKTRRR